MMQDRHQRLPIFRTETQRKLLVELLFDDREWPRTLTDLARDIGVEQTTVMREVNRLLESGLISERRVGRSRTVEIDEHSPFTAPLRQLLRGGSRSTEERELEPLPHLARDGRKRRGHRPLPSAQTRP